MAATMFSIPPSAKCSELSSNFEIKQTWMYQEWDGSNAIWKRMIQTDFPNREDLHPSNPTPQIKKIEALFNKMRGEYSAIWGDVREHGKWIKVEVKKSDPEWVCENVEVLYPTEERLEARVTEISGLVLWKDPGMPKYQLKEGNHRVSSWLNLKHVDESWSPKGPLPEAIPCMLYIGRPA